MKIQFNQHCELKVYKDDVPNQFSVSEYKWFFKGTEVEVRNVNTDTFIGLSSVFYNKGGCSLNVPTMLFDVIN